MWYYKFIQMELLYPICQKKKEIAAGSLVTVKEALVASFAIRVLTHNMVNHWFG